MTSLAAGLVLVLGLSGCSSANNLPAHNAPRSNMARDNALALARVTAAAVGGEVFAVSRTGSMKPVLDECSIVAVEHTPFERLQVGDIVIYRTPTGTPIIHRLYAKQTEGWLVLGDNNATIDPEAVTKGNFVGRVCAIFYTSSSYPSANAAYASADAGEKPE